MRQPGTLITATALQNFHRFQQLNPDELQALACHLRIETARPGQRLFCAGDTDPRDIFLLSGELKLIAIDGRSTPVIANSNAARHPIARLRPRQYTAVAKTSVEYFLMEACHRAVAPVVTAQPEPLGLMEVAEISLEEFQRVQANYLQQRRNAA